MFPFLFFNATFLAYLAHYKLQQLPPNTDCGPLYIEVHSNTVFPLSFRYDPNERRYCRWLFVSDPGYIGRLECATINLPPSPACSSDKLIITSIDESSKRQIYCDYGYKRLVVFGTQIDVELDTSRQTSGGHFVCQVTAMLTDCSCGYKYPQPQPLSRIYGGVETGVNEFPMMARVIITTPDSKYACGGTIISKRIVLTAAHCVFGYDRTQITVYAGEHDITKRGKKSIQRFTVDEALIHSHYRSFRIKNRDIALLRLDRDIQFSKRVGPACLPFKYTHHDFTGTVVTAVGWGVKSNKKKVKKLRKVDLNVTSLDYCQVFFWDVDEEIMCSYEKSKGSCYGDSGGPLLYTEPGTGRQFIVAVIKGGSGCASQYPSINVDVVQKLEWITSLTPGVQYCVK